MPGPATPPWIDETGLPATLASAIEAALSADPALASLAPGGVFNGVAKDGSNLASKPYVVFVPIAITPFFNSAMFGYYQYVDLRMNCYAPEVTVAEMIGEAILKARPRLNAMRFRDGYLMTILFTGGSTLPAEARGVGNTRIWNRTLTFRAKVGRSYP